MNSDDYVDIVKIMMMKWCLCDVDDHDQDCDVVDQFVYIYTIVYHHARIITIFIFSIPAYNDV